MGDVTIEKTSQNKSPAPARISVLMASEAPLAVVFRRGPTRWTRLYLWNTVTDQFIPGSWFAGGLVPAWSDLSPDGQHLLYFARNESRRRQEQGKAQFQVKHFYTWTALCRPPWVRALGLWNASDFWSGGGLFIGNRQVRLYHSPDMEQALIEPEGFAVSEIHPKERGFIELERLLRTGWAPSHLPDRWNGDGNDLPIILQKGALECHFGLRAGHQRYRAYFWKASDSQVDLSQVCWADLDAKKQLVYAREGKLFRFREGAEVELADLNLDQPRRTKAAGSAGKGHLD